MLKEFRDFAMKGNVLDLAVGVIIGAAFGKIVNSLVEDIIMPPIGMVLGRVDFSSLYLNLSGGEFSSLAEAKKAGAATVNYGVFLTNTLNFIIVAFAVFFLVKQFNRFRSQPPVAESTLRECPYCVSQISKKASKCSCCGSSVTPVG